MSHIDESTQELILDQIMTLGEAINFANCLSIVESSIYQENFMKDIYNENRVKPYYPLLNKLFKLEDLTKVSLDKIAEKIREIHVWIRDLSPTKYVISFEPTSEFIRQLYLWTKNNVDNKSLIDIEVRPEIVGGVIVSTNGRYGDFCLDKMLNEYFSSNKDAVISILQE